MPLNDARIRAAKPGAKRYKLADGGGLYLVVEPNGSKLWRYKYRIGGRENIYSLGAYPGVGILAARRAHLAARELVMRGEHPVKQKREIRAAQRFAAANTFKAIAEEWYESKVTAKRWTAYYADQVRTGLDRDLLPALGALPIDQITPLEILDVLRGVVVRGAPSVAINLRQWASQVFRLAVLSNRATSDPAATLKGVVLKPPVKHAEALGREKAGILLNRIQGYGGNLITRCALKLMVYTSVRTVEMRKAEWSEFDLDAMIWQIPAEKMKKKRVHLVPLVPQVVDVLNQLRPLTGAGRFLFPNTRRSDAVMSATTVNRALEHMGYPSGEVTGHDFRATASTMLYEQGYSSEVVEMQLAHVETNKTKRSYNHAKYLAERRAMMQWFADQLDASAAEQAALALTRAVAS
jgi:integrase